MMQPTEPEFCFSRLTDNLRIQSPRGASDHLKRMFLDQFLTLAVSQAMEEIQYKMTRRVHTKFLH